MRKSFTGLLSIAAVVAVVFGVTLLLAWFSGRKEMGESPAERRAKDLAHVKTLLAKWDSLDPAAREAAMPELASKVWQFGDPDLRWRATFDLAHSGPKAAALFVALLTEPDEDVRIHALWGLGILGPECPRDPKLFGAVKECLHDSNADVRGNAVFAVWRIAAGPADAVPALVQTFNDSDTEVRESAGRAVARFGRGALPELRKGLQHPSLDVRRLSVTTFGLIGADAAEAVPELLALLRDPKSGLQDETADALAGIGAPAVAALAEALKQEQDSAVRKRAILALAKVGKPAVPVLAKVLSDPDASVRLQGVTALGRIGSDAVEALALALQDQDAEVRQEVARVLGTLNKGDAGVVPALVKALQDPKDIVRGQAITSLWALRPEADAVLKGLTPVLDDKNIDVRLDAIRYLRELGPPAVPLLALMLKDPDPKVCQRVIESLDEVRAPADVLFPALMPVLKSDSATARQNAASILWRCGPPAVQPLLDALKDGNSLVRVAALRSLYQANADSKATFPAFVAALDDTSPVVRASAASALSRFGLQALPSLRLALKDKDPSVRQYTVLALQEMKGSPKDVLPLVIESQKDDSAIVRAAASVSLGSFGTAALPHLIAALKDDDEGVWKKAIESLKRLEGSNAVMVRALIDALNDEHYPVRRGAAYVLSRFGVTAVDPLLTALKDEDPRVRAEAADSLRVVGPEAEKAMGPLAALAVGDADMRVRKDAVAAMLSIHGLNRFRDEPIKAVPMLIESLQNRHPQTRWEAAQILGVIGPPAKEAVGALTKATQDNEQRVSQAATAALGRVKQ